MAEKSKNFLVSTADVAFFHNGMLAFTGNTSLNTSISVSMEDQEITGGKGDMLLYKFKYGRRLSLTIEMAEWRLEYIAAQVGSTIFQGLKDVFSIAECVTLTNGVGTLAHEPVGKEVFVELADGSILTVTPEGSTISIETDEEILNVNATYQYNSDVKRITIDADSTPLVGELVLSADEHNNLKGKVGEVQIDIPSFQFNGTFDISMESTGNTTTEMDGDALAVAGVSCTDGDVYAYITEIPSEESTVSVADIAATPALMSLTVGEAKTISIIGIKGGLYSNISIDNTECEFSSDDTSVATVDEAGEVTGVAAGQTYIHVTYGDTGDTVDVTVTEE